MDANEQDRLALLERAKEQQARVAALKQEHFGPDDPDKSVFGRIFDALRGGTDRARNAKRIAKQAGKTKVIDETVFGLGQTIKKGDVASLNKAFNASAAPHEKIVLLNAMLAHPGWVPRQTFFSFLEMDMIDPLQMVQTGHVLGFFRNDETKRAEAGVFQSRSEAEAQILAKKDAQLRAWVQDGLLTAEEAHLPNGAAV